MKNQYVGLILAIFVLGGIVVMNRWIMREINSASGPEQQIQLSRDDPMSEAVVKQSIPLNQSTSETTTSLQSVAQQEPAANEKKGDQEDQKVIYEPPLEDVTLVQ